MTDEPTGGDSPPPRPTEQELFFAALELDDPAERTAWLEEACGGDAALLGRVRGLLEIEGEDDTFLEPDEQLLGEAVGMLEVGVHEQTGDTIGRYKLLQKIGEGGGGVVYMADQTEPVKRRVALKVIKLGMDTRQVVARFEAERQALALMDHPNIAKVLDAGATESGRPYFVMELVRGVPITSFCDEHKLSTTERLELFIQICEAVQHAHQKGIIHRDLKPGNVLVTMMEDRPVPKVIDFGVAKATQQELTEKTLFTQHGHFIGTPAYMSPEQASMTGYDIDTRSDVYALGVLLYELLTGRTPFDSSSLLKVGYDEIRRVIAEADPPKPSTRISTMDDGELSELASHRQSGPRRLSRLVRGDLDWIVMKALEKDRRRRYETANGFAMDVRRHLANEPVSAGRPSLAHKAAKFARRNKTALGVAATIALILVAATAVSSWQAVRAIQAEQRVTETLAVVAAERDAKEQARRNAEEISTFMTEVFQSPDPTRDGRKITVAESLDKAVERLETELVDQPEQRAKLRATLGSTYASLGLDRRAIPLQKKVRSYYLSARGPEHPDTLVAMSDLGHYYGKAGLETEALKIFEELLRLCLKVHGPEHPETIRAMGGLANSHAVMNRQEKALELREKVLELCRKNYGPEDPDTITAKNNLARSYDATGRWEEALKMREEVLELRRKLYGSDHPDTLISMTHLASSFKKAGRWDQVLKIHEEVLELRRKLLGPEHPATLGAMTNLAGTYRVAGRLNEAVALQEKALALKRRHLLPTHPFLVIALENMADLYERSGRLDEALKLREEALELRRKILGPEHPDTLEAMSNLAFSYAHVGRPEKALEMLKKALELRQKVLGLEHPDTLGAMTNLASSYMHAGRLEDAVVLQEKALALKRRHLPPAHPFFAIALQHMADLYEETGRKAEAGKLRAELEELKAKR